MNPEALKEVQRILRERDFRAYMRTSVGDITLDEYILYSRRFIGLITQLFPEVTTELFPNAIIPLGESLTSDTAFPDEKNEDYHPDFIGISEDDLNEIFDKSSTLKVVVRSTKEEDSPMFAVIEYDKRKPDTLFFFAQDPHDQSDLRNLLYGGMFIPGTYQIGLGSEEVRKEEEKVLGGSFLRT